jgi:Xaa-Pro dipeptidase
VLSLEQARLSRLREQMNKHDVAAVFTADPINIAYATGARNMAVFSMMGATRFLLVVAEGPAILWEFGGSEHLATGLDTIDEVRTAPGVTALSGPTYRDAIVTFAAEIADVCAEHIDGHVRIGVERVDHDITDAIRAAGLTLASATEVFVAARLIKLDVEVDVMREAMWRVVDAVDATHAAIEHGRTEVEVWSKFHQHLIATGGEYVSTRLVQAGERTFPYFQEAGSHRLVDGDLFCIDTDAIGYGSYAVDFSRTFVCGDRPMTPDQRSLHAMALDQLRHNAAALMPGRSFADFSSMCWAVPERLAPFGYYCVAHGLGMSGEYPYIPLQRPGEPFPLDGHFEPGMVICIESYIGDPDIGRGIKLEDQYLITNTGAELLSTSPHPAF